MPSKPSKPRGKIRVSVSKKPAAQAPQTRSTADRLNTIERLLRTAETDRAELALRQAFAIDHFGKSVDKLTTAVHDNGPFYADTIGGSASTAFNFSQAATDAGVVEVHDRRGFWQRAFDWFIGRDINSARAP